jgi:quaternary ammonium compound-resistance protein SugE
MSGTARFVYRRAEMAWIMLLVAGIFEVVWAVAMKQSAGFTRLVPSVVTLIGMLVSFVLLTAAMRSIPLGTAYTIWTGIGAVGAFVAGVVLLGEQLNAMRVIAAVLIVSGLVMMKLSAD